ncbi:gamma-glutamylcyclotransferase family protein [Spirosoma montaniterrae]|uniref:Gamma-glutamylcyclotransferase AIG2-like domain-containing protein n=1 Tax=Spirosoma montaniterrae TaxID=1178516 RepID=A0A1P9X1I4_9BACT|nr:gamma-glutamylcyclotransferase family protein [Spirosoma montaniterrae]AQG81502.1 hypothetical protein AWR27_20605 [Spirosoma montaniterrae]
MEKPPIYLFVYGTLRPGFTNAYARLLHQHGRYIGDGIMPGRLFNLGSYPGATYEPDCPTFVHGAVYDISNNPTILTRLDRYEGVSQPPRPADEYIRVAVSVEVAGKPLTCWTYVYNWPLAEKQVIESGRYG